jgi:LuxR family quorum sensing-dependent transcriptional regulator
MSEIPFSSLQAFSQVCLKAAKADDIARPLTNILNDAGFTSWYAGSLVHDSQLERGFGFFGMPEGWRERYAEARHCDADPVFRGLLQDGSSLVWSECRERAVASGAPKRALNVFHEAADFGLEDGFAMQTPSFGGVPGAVTFGGSDPDLSPTAQLSLRLVGAFAYEGLRRLVEGFKPVPRALSKRELEVLRWTAEGKTAWEIGAILTIGERTVRTYQDQIKTKYRVSTLIQAVVQATLDGTLAFARTSTRYN